MNLFIGAIATGLMWAFLSLGTFISFRLFRSLDLTTEGAFVTGGAVACALLIRGVSPPTATALGALAGAASGALTGLIHTRLKVDVVLAGILVMTASYSVNYWTMGGGVLSLAGHQTLFEQAGALVGGDDPTGLRRDVAGVILLSALVGGLTLILCVFATTDLGLALRATGSSPRMARASAIDTGLATTIGLALANAFTGLSGALFAQYSGSAGVGLGPGMIVVGLASLILGESLFPQRTIRRRIVAAALGAVAFRLLVAAAIRAGLDSTSLKLVTAAFVLGALTLPGAVRSFRNVRRARAADG